jgi:thiamine-phosphate pyrophosphorylase
MHTYENLIAITNRHLCDDKPALTSFLNQIDRIASCGVKAIVLREKDLSCTEYTQLAMSVLPLCEKHHTPLILHNFTDTAKVLHHDAIHLPLQRLRELQLDVSTHEAGTVLSHFRVIGTSIHSVEDALEAQKLGATYLFAGNIFETSCKQGLPGRGLSFLQDVCACSDIPVYAIGGITPDNLSTVMSAGATGACMMSGFMNMKF